METATLVTALLMFSTSWGYRYEPHLNPQQTELTTNEHGGEYYSQTIEYQRWHTGAGDRTKPGTGDRTKPGPARFNGTLKIINILPAHKHQAVQEDASSKNDDGATRIYDGIVFPDTPVSKASKSFAPKIPDECKKKTFCDEIPDYPTDYVESVLKNSADPWHPTVDQLIQDVEINHRIGFDSDDIDLCKSQEKIHKPKAAENWQKKWRMVINTENFVQGLRVEVCQEPESPCNKNVAFPPNARNYCKQKFILREMRALDADGQIITDTFRIPSCCSCVYRMN